MRQILLSLIIAVHSVPYPHAVSIDDWWSAWRYSLEHSVL
jgi:hypothetical protein